MDKKITVFLVGIAIISMAIVALSGVKKGDKDVNRISDVDIARQDNIDYDKWYNDNPKMAIPSGMPEPTEEEKRKAKVKREEYENKIEELWQNSSLNATLHPNLTLISLDGKVVNSDKKIMAFKEMDVCMFKTRFNITGKCENPNMNIYVEIYDNKNHKWAPTTVSASESWIYILPPIQSNKVRVQTNFSSSKSKGSGLELSELIMKGK